MQHRSWAFAVGSDVVCGAKESPVTRAKSQGLHQALRHILLDVVHSSLMVAFMLSCGISCYLCYLLASIFRRVLGNV